MRDPNMKYKPLISRRHGDEGHVIVHLLQWSDAHPPFTLCKQYTLRTDPTPAQIERDKDLVVNCLGCIAEME